MIDLRRCPNCGSERIARVRGAITRDFEGQRYTVPNVHHYACPECGEKVFDKDAARTILAHSPAFRGETARP